MLHLVVDLEIECYCVPCILFLAVSFGQKNTDPTCKFCVPPDQYHHFFFMQWKDFCISVQFI